MPGWEHGARYIPIAEEKAAEQAGQSDAGAATNAERSHRLRVLGASITGDKDTDLSDAQLEQLIERTVRSMMARISGTACDATDGQAATAQTDTASAQARTAPAQVETTQSNAAQAQPVQLDSTETATAQTEPAQSETAANETVQTGATQAAPAQCAIEPDATSDVEAWLLEGICAQDRAWPDNCAELKRLFANTRRVYPLELPGFVFVRAPLAGGGSCAVGVKCEDGRPSEVAYLIPGRYAPQPPAGLEGYVWREGDGGGFWVARQDAFTGNMLFD